MRKNRIKKIQILLIAAVMVLTTLLSHTTLVKASSGESGDLSECIVILCSNDAHGDVWGYSYMAGLKNYFERLNAKVILVDTGDYSQGSPYVNTSKGASAIDLMNTVDYDVVSLGSHEFDYGYAQLKGNMAKANFDVVCANVLDSNGNSIFQSNTIVERDGVKIGFFGLATPETQEKDTLSHTDGLTFASGQDLYNTAQAQVNELKSKGADLVICLSQLGVDEGSKPNSSYDLYKNTTGIDLIMDGHSHSVMLGGCDGEPIMQAGNAFSNIGAVLIEEANETKKIDEWELIELKIKDDSGTYTDYNIDLSYLIDYESDGNKVVNDAVSALENQINTLYAAKLAENEMELNGDTNANQTTETNLGDLIADSMLWKAVQKGGINVDDDHIVAITNGGSIQASLDSGDVTRNDIQKVLPDDNTIAVTYLKGSELLEMLEASTFNTPNALASFPQISGMEIEIDTTRAYDANDTVYPGTSYYGPRSIRRVTIKNINGKPFDENETYAVVTNQILAAGGDTYYAFTNASAQFDTYISMNEALAEYIENALEGKITAASYGSARGRIKVVTSHTISSEPVQAVYDCENGGHIAYYPCLDEGCDAKFADPEGNVRYKESEVIIAPKDHTIKTVGAVEATDKKDGYTGDVKCTDCGKVIEKGKVIPAFGNKNTDQNIETGAEKKQPSDSVSPATGDTNKYLALIVTLMFASLSIICVCVIRNNRNAR